jgi:phosphoesterase RecJ-like protein
MLNSANILSEIKNAKSILLHCHPSPDPDSVGSALAMKFALESFGKKVTVIRGDSEIPQAFMHFPGAKDIEDKNFSETNLKNFDLFIIQDSGSPEMISRKNTPTLPLPIKTIIIDHHASNTSYADINLVDPKASSVTYILYNLFKEWGVEITPSIASNLFIGLYTDTGGFRFAIKDYKVFEVITELVKVIPNYTDMIFIMENSLEKESIYAQGIALSSIETFLNDNLAISTVSYSALSSKNILPSVVSEGYIAGRLKSVVGWNIAVSMVEIEPNKVKISFRTRDAQVYDVSRLAVELGGGGHKAASGAVLSMPLDEAMKKVVETAKIIYNL